LREAEYARIRGIFADTGLTLSSITYYEINLHPQHGLSVNAHVQRGIDATAPRWHVGRTGPRATVRDNLECATDVLGPLVEDAGERNGEIVIENRVMKIWNPDGFGRPDQRRGGSTERVQTGLGIAYRTLRHLIPG
jgi:hypothetical protein